MTAPFRLWRPAVLVLALVVSGCVSTRTSPRGIIPTNKTVATDVRGAWIQVRTVDGGVVQGELLAVEPRGDVHILTTSSQYQRVEVASVADARLEAYRNAWESAAGWAGAGTASTLTHGFILGLSMPIWGAAGSTASVAQSATGFHRIPSKMSWASASAYARFPAGLPEGLEPDRLLFYAVPFGAPTP